MDVYNAISVAHLIPVGGEDTDRIQGGDAPRPAPGREEFVTVAGGEQVVEHPEAGEVRVARRRRRHLPRWNWRQGPRTRLTERIHRGVFLLESLAPMPVADVERAGAELAELLEKFSPGARIDGPRPG